MFVSSRRPRELAGNRFTFLFTRTLQFAFYSFFALHILRSLLCLHTLNIFRGRHPRWYYDSKAGLCSQFEYSGCRGNLNRCGVWTVDYHDMSPLVARFHSEEECQNRCRHAALARRTERVCSQPIGNADMF